jgi:hypothetical protein
MGRVGHDWVGLGRLGLVATEEKEMRCCRIMDRGERSFGPKIN